MSETWFDKRSGKLFIGRDAATPYLEPTEGAEYGLEPAVELAPLAELLDAKQLDFPVDHIPFPNDAGLTRENLLTYGHWLMTLLEKNGKPQPLRERHLRRMRSLGLGASYHTIYGEFDNLINFKEEIGSPFLNGHGRFDHWGIADYVRYAQDLATRLGRKPEEPDYLKAAADDDGPGLSAIYDRVGGLGQLSEYIGFPDIRGWDKEDFIIWGVQALRANPETGIPVMLIEGLSKLKRGPSMKTVANRFVKVSIFQAEVEAALEQELAENAAWRTEKLRLYRKQISNGIIDESLHDQEDRLLIVGAQRLLVERLLPNIPESRKRALAQRPSHNFISYMMRENDEVDRLGQANRSLTPGAIETEAVALGVFDDIWPVKNELKHLRFRFPKNRRPKYKPGQYREYLAKQAA